MTETLSGFGQSHFGRSALDHLSESGEQHWQPHFPDPFPMLTAGWPQPAGSHMSGIQHLDLRFDQDPQGYYTPPHMPSPRIGYTVSDIGTPSSTGYHQDAVETYPQVSGSTHLHPSAHRLSAPQMQSPHSSASGLSPSHGSLASPQTAQLDVRPVFKSHNSAPEPATLRQGMIKKHKGSSDEEDADYEPAPGQRGRKRQRIPHTAVERRYRENLNAHLEKLRQTVPSLAARKGAGGSKVEGGEGVKPSKCEILHGAIEYIGAQDKQIALKDKHIVDLTNENQALRASLDQLQDWIRANSH